MSFERTLNRNMIKKQTKEHNEGVPKKYRRNISDIWHYFQEQKYGTDEYIKIIKRNEKKYKKRGKRVGKR